MPVNVFVSYEASDEELSRELVSHLAALKRRGEIVLLSHQDVAPGDVPERSIKAMIASSQVVLLLISAAFLESERCMRLEANVASEQSCRVIPVPLRDCDWQADPHPCFSLLPDKVTAIMSYPDRHPAWAQVAKAVRSAVEEIQSSPEPPRGGSTSGPNPFEYGSAVPPERFVGRRAQRADLRGRLGGISAQSVSIVGLHRSGRTSLFKYIEGRTHELCSADQNPLVVYLDLQAARYQTPRGILEGIRRGVEGQLGRSPWDPRHTDDEYAVEEGLLALSKQGARLVVLIDEFESIAARLDRFQDWGADFRSKASRGCFALVIATQRPLGEVYAQCGLTSPFDNIFSTTTLGAFAREEWRELVVSRYQQSSASPSDADLDLVDELSGGLPFYVQMAGSLLWQHRAHKEVRAAFAIQSEATFTRLWGKLTLAEQLALRRASGVSGASEKSVIHTLTRYGLLRADGSIFSSAFAAFVRGRT